MTLLSLRKASPRTMVCWTDNIVLVTRNIVLVTRNIGPVWVQVQPPLGPIFPGR